MEKLCMWLIDNKTDEWYAQWALFRGLEKIAVSDEAQPLAEIAGALPPAGMMRNIIVIVPGKDVLLSHVNIPLTQKRHIHKILPFLIEDRLAEPLNALHIVAGKIDEKGKLPVAVVKISLMQQWLDVLKNTGITAHELVAETSLLQGNWQLLVNDQMAWLHVNEYESYSVERAQLPELLSILRKDHPGTCSIECTQTDASPVQLLGYEVQIKPIQSVLDVFCSGALSGQGALNLLQGQFQASAANTSNPWKPLVRIAAIWCIGIMLLTGGEAFWLSHKTAQAHEQMVALYRQLFPSDSKIVDARRQMESHIIGGTASETGFLTFLQQIASQWPVGDPTTLQIQNMSYSEAENILTLSVTAKTMDVITKLAEKLNNNGLISKLQSVVNSNGGIVGQLMVKGGAR